MGGNAAWGRGLLAFIFRRDGVIGGLRVGLRVRRVGGARQDAAGLAELADKLVWRDGEGVRVIDGDTVELSFRDGAGRLRRLLMRTLGWVESLGLLP